MPCPICHKTGHVLVNANDCIVSQVCDAVRQITCPECGGFTELNCCEGMREQPEPKITQGEELR
jgi:hypothetical protein